MMMYNHGMKGDMQQLIDKYKLVPHPEGGYFREVFRSGQKVFSTVADAKRDAVTHIYFLLIKGQVSRFHKVLHDEIWNFYEGSPLRLVQYDGTKLQEEIVGGTSGSYVSFVAGGLYQAAESTGEYSLVGCTVAPGFDFGDFSFLSDDPDAVSAFIQKNTGYEKFV
jgi:predicted cupin superfamily sugar epimerase